MTTGQSTSTMVATRDVVSRIRLLVAAAGDTVLTEDLLAVLNTDGPSFEEHPTDLTTAVDVVTDTVEVVPVEDSAGEGAEGVSNDGVKVESLLARVTAYVRDYPACTASQVRAMFDGEHVHTSARYGVRKAYFDMVFGTVAINQDMNTTSDMAGDTDGDMAGDTASWLAGDVVGIEYVQVQHHNFGTGQQAVRVRPVVRRKKLFLTTYFRSATIPEPDTGGMVIDGVPVVVVDEPRWSGNGTSDEDGGWAYNTGMTASADGIMNALTRTMTGNQS